MRTQVVGIGAGGHARVVLDILGALPWVQVVGLVDNDPSLFDTRVSGVPVLGPDAILGELHREGVRAAFIGVGSVGDTSLRIRLYEMARALGFEIVPAIHQGACVSAAAELGAGPTVMPGAVINACAVLGANVIVNSGAIVEHDCRVADHVHIASGACLAGAVRVGRGAFVGARAVVRQRIVIGDGAVVGAGAVVVRDVRPGAVVTGVPARERTAAEAGIGAAGCGSAC
ncbi:MAG: NeuD/PglB/VioB family sugar acetyltransferase [Kiritimatiellae bacterium]|nr:NeuD/PglB/VioB family sugar acetyltransferase [Kiritimatiellia bacterium]